MTDEMTARALQASWRAAEQSLYVIGGGVEQYQRAIALVRAVSDLLADVTSSEELLARWPEAAELVARAEMDVGLPPGSLPLDRVAGAAFALRHGALLATEAQRARIAAIDAARADGADWARLQETGRRESGLADPYRSLRMHVASGLALLVAVQPDPATGAPSWSVTVLRLDPATGSIADGDAEVADRVYDDLPALAAGEAELARLVECGELTSM